MSIFDSATELCNKGMSVVNRGSRAASLAIKEADLQRQREQACAALGASVFEDIRNNAEIRASREDLFAAIESLDEQLAKVAEEKEVLEAEKRAAEAAAAAAAAAPETCAACGAKLLEGASFCSNCGTKVPEPNTEAPAESSAVCPNCGTALSAGAAFCGNCGTKL